MGVPHIRAISFSFSSYLSLKFTLTPYTVKCLLAGPEATALSVPTFALSGLLYSHL